MSSSLISSEEKESKASFIVEKQRDLNQLKSKIKQKRSFRNGFIHRLIFRNDPYHIKGQASKSFNRRTYELPIQSLDYVNQENLGFTNQILCKQQDKGIQLYIPVYLTLKVKSIQEICLNELLAKVGCVLKVFVNIRELPKEMIDYIQKHILIQINRGESIKLCQDEKGQISLKRNNAFLEYTVRQAFPTQIDADIFISPFEILNLIFSVTFNSLDYVQEPIQGQQQKMQEKNKTYSISFNCMRHPLEVPITFAKQCELGVYHLAEKMLDSYASNKSTYNEIIQKIEKYLDKKDNNDVEINGQQKNVQQKQKDAQKEKKDNKNVEANVEQKKVKKKQKNFKKEQKDVEKNKNKLVKENAENINPKVNQQKPLTMEHSDKKQKEQKVKVKYFQYQHFVIPLYKLPGNAWATIFIPMFMLSLLSIFIHLQKTTPVAQKLGSIATFVLGFIALIPSIKNSLPPSQTISLCEIIVYVESINCMLSLFQVFFRPSVPFVTNAQDNLFIFSLLVHFICAFASSFLLFLHYFIWEPKYNIRKEVDMSSPTIDYLSWNNPYCDEVFLEYNSKMKMSKSYEKLIHRYCLKEPIKLNENYKENKPTSP